MDRRAISCCTSRFAGRLARGGKPDEAARAYAAPIERLVRACEFDPEARRDLSQEIHIALWRSFAGFEARCSLRTWVYRISHNTAASHVIRHRRAASSPTVGLDRVEQLAAAGDPDAAVDRQRMLERPRS